MANAQQIRQLITETTTEPRADASRPEPRHDHPRARPYSGSTEVDLVVRSGELERPPMCFARNRSMRP